MRKRNNKSYYADQDKNFHSKTGRKSFDTGCFLVRLIDYIYKKIKSLKTQI